MARVNLDDTIGLAQPRLHILVGIFWLYTISTLGEVIRLGRVGLIATVDRIIESDI